MSLQGKCAVVTGGSRGIGRAVCLELADQGADLLLNYAGNREAAEETAALCREKGVRAEIQQGDVSRAEDCSALFGQAAELYGRVDILVNNAGITRDTLLLRMSEEDFDRLFHRMILQFPACEIDFMLPGYLDALPGTHWIKATMIAQIQKWMEDFDTIGQAADTCRQIIDGSVIKDVQITRTDPASGMVVLQPQLAAGLYYKVIEELLDARVENDSQLFVMLREYAQAKKAYDGMKGALAEVANGNYGIVAPKLSEMVLEKPEVFKQGSKYGVRMKATAPCLHIIKTNITTEVSPVVGTESQSVDLAQNLAEQFGKDGDTIWETNLFGKSLKDMVTEQMESKVSNVPENLRGKVQRSLQKISDEGKDYFICIIL